ncbi:nitrogen fixation protein FixH [Thioclava sp. SK-1]|uniref:FixH family protein n=1 Tax=Thioclava sp. SK-1 TaxID=1889770 RepID=UPI0008268E7C|nr:FixH family protein [Thioclava sp. SK-1]OCX66663.1 nitrogen fixation protein FixH [Thioclava sp. SK-1]
MRELTGKHVLGAMIAAFGVIIGVNLVMAYQAVSTFPGLEVQNSYIASQKFNAARAAQLALGWHVEPRYHNGELSFVIRDAQGLPAPIADLSALVGRKTYAGADRRPQFSNQGGVYSAPITLTPGAWLVHLNATAKDGTQFRQRIDMFVKG